MDPSVGDALRHAAAQPVQFTLWEQLQADSNLVALYDLAPRFVLGTEADAPAVRVITREFSISERRYQIVIKPTQVFSQSDGRYYTRYLGFREQIIEDVIRRLATKRSRLSLVDNDVRFVFSLYEVLRELSRLKKTMSLSELKEGLSLLSEVKLTIQSLDAGTIQKVTLSPFSAVAMRGKTDSDDVETYVQFNPLVAESIRLADYYSTDYETLMALKTPVAKWLYRRLHLDIINSDTPIQVINAQEIQSGSGAINWQTKRNALRKLRLDVSSLKDAGILENLEERPILVGRQVDDYEFVMTASSAFMSSIANSKWRHHLSQQELRRVKATNSTAKFPSHDRQDQARVRGLIGAPRRLPS